MPSTSPARIWSAAYLISEISGVSLLIFTISARTASFPACICVKIFSRGTYHNTAKGFKAVVGVSFSQLPRRLSECNRLLALTMRIGGRREIQPIPTPKFPSREYNEFSGLPRTRHDRARILNYRTFSKTFGNLQGGSPMLASNAENPTTVGLESIISTAQLSRRRTRAPNHVAENDALIALAEKMATSPHDILQ